MWYVIQVRTGTEEDIQTQCAKLIGSEALERSFIPYSEQMKRYHGQWHKEKKPLFPGYVFLISPDKEQLFLQLKQVIGLTKLLGTGDEIVPLTEEEIRFLLEFGSEEQIVAMSEGIIENDQVLITRGPLKGREGLIKRIDRPQAEGVPGDRHVRKDAQDPGGAGDCGEEIGNMRNGNESPEGLLFLWGKLKENHLGG